MSLLTVNAALLARAQQGDTTARAEFLREVGPSVAALIHRLGSRSDAQDQLHEVFAHLLEVLPRFDPDGPAQLSTWVFTVAHRWLLMQKRKAAPVLVALDGALSKASTTADATEYVEGRQLNALLEAELARLPEDQRRTFVLTQLHQQPMEEVAAAEGVALGTVKSRLHRARAQLVIRMGAALDRVPQNGGGGRVAS
jgi:RNA polymerase sigma-70 factor, ECF subfamily